MYCNLGKSQVIPLVCKISSQSKTHQAYKFQSFSNGGFLKPLQTLKPRNFSSGGYRKDGFGTKTRKWSNGYSQKGLEGGGESEGRGRKTLPWITSAYKSKEKKVSNKVPHRSSWEESASKYDSKNVEGTNRLEAMVESRRDGGRERDESEVGEKMVEIRRGGRRERDESEVGGEVEIVDDPRWDRIKSRSRRIIDRDARPARPEVRRWDKQEDWGRKTWKEASESTLPKMSGEGIYGVGPVLAALSAGRREFYTLYVQDGLDLSSNNRKKKDKKGFEKILRIAEKVGLTKKEVSKHDLNMVVDNRPHQGLVLDASPLDLISIRELDPLLVDGEIGPLWVALDEVTDPQNLGAIIRSSYFFGAAGVVLCAKNSAPLSGVVSKASAGSLELMELRSCKNMMQFLSSSAQNGWRVLGGSISSKAIPLNEVPAGAPTILVLGSEGKGLRPLVERSCTDLVRIPGNIPIEISTIEGEEENVDEVEHSSVEEFRSFMAVESLNVSVAAGVLLHHLVGNNHNHGVDDKQATLPPESLSGA